MWDSICKRAEFDHLTELLRSRTVELPEEDAKKAFEPRTLLPAGDYRNKEVEIVSGQENEIEDSKFVGAISTPVTALKIPRVLERQNLGEVSDRFQKVASHEGKLRVSPLSQFADSSSSLDESTFTQRTWT
ncbi:hypothetical protein Taro_046983 [Colocasia esculenta]|uniref:Uncharacterized protein n=1 Tax=Colocasia esculenta TaxID=4460 RepID=A0A843X6Q6_COLES|nr:hypothetical protein [Colocasia esculenta]